MLLYRHTSRLAIHGEAGDKAALYRDRYQVLLQRLARDIYFSKPAFDTVMTEDDNCEVFFFVSCHDFHKIFLVLVCEITYTLFYM